MKRTEHPPNSGKWNPWPAAIISFFALAVLGVVSFVVFCNRHPADLTDTDYYDQEIRFQGQMDRSERARSFPANTGVSYDAASNAITVALPPSHVAGQPTGEIELYRPSASSQDQRVKLALNAAGKQQIDTRKMAAGLWKVRVRWSAAGQDYYLDGIVVVAPRLSST